MNKLVSGFSGDFPNESQGVQLVLLRFFHFRAINFLALSSEERIWHITIAFSHQALTSGSRQKLALASA